MLTGHTQHRRIERIREGLIDYSDLQSSGTKVGIKRRIENREAAEKALIDFKSARRQQLLTRVCNRGTFGLLYEMT